ncbi:MAG: hypothetical protein TR69_WS6001000168 [candidate division WS6 bacterium OLB20]|uniref:Uncharacterized protein n=1 Tax=candidate division WS6 bacterium OLB20 TaxID=1617426 RepID=A0A136M066_9BACT|nr:MAG: hypothetical protein TR69_WS6001000168 [candidate division WS6 bacterium OLB20]
MEVLLHGLENLIGSKHSSFDEAMNRVISVAETMNGPATLIMDLDGVMNDDSFIRDYPFLALYQERLLRLAQMREQFPDMSVKVLTGRMRQFNWAQDWISDLQNAMNPDNPEQVSVVQLYSDDEFNAFSQTGGTPQTILTGAGKNLKERIMLHAARPFTNGNVPGGMRIKDNMLHEAVDIIVRNTTDNIIVLDGEHDMLPAFHYAAEHHNHRSFEYVSVAAEERTHRRHAFKAVAIAAASLALLHAGRTAHSYSRKR